jgi:hypothetical protein
MGRSFPMSFNLFLFPTSFYSDDCRFPHILPEGTASHPSTYFSGRGGLRSRGNNTNGNGNGTIEEKLAGLKNVRTLIR